MLGLRQDEENQVVQGAHAEAADVDVGFYAETLAG
jgi:hypothetical protein